MFRCCMEICNNRHRPAPHSSFVQKSAMNGETHFQTLVLPSHSPSPARSFRLYFPHRMGALAVKWPLRMHDYGATVRSCLIHYCVVRVSVSAIGLSFEVNITFHFIIFLLECTADYVWLSSTTIVTATSANINHKVNISLYFYTQRYTRLDISSFWIVQNASLPLPLSSTIPHNSNSTDSKSWTNILSIALRHSVRRLWPHVTAI